MSLKIIGATLVIIGCGGFGCMVAANARAELYALKQLISALDFIECELSYRLTSLPQLCRLAAAITNGCVCKMFISLAEELEKQSVPAVESCVKTAVNKCPKLPKLIMQRMEELSRSLGAFDLAGQLKCIKAINSENRQILKNIGLGYQVRLRSYKTLGICAGAALVILFI